MYWQGWVVCTYILYQAQNTVGIYYTIAFAYALYFLLHFPDTPTHKRTYTIYHLNQTHHPVGYILLLFIGEQWIGGDK